MHHVHFLSNRTHYKLLGPCLIGLLAAGVGIGGCQRNQNSLGNSNPNVQDEIQNLQTRLDKLESQGKQTTKVFWEKREKAPLGHIKSITFRLGTSDDRLRIYWADGSKSDLPCTKEQSIWACG